MILVDRVSKRFGPIWALEDVSFEVRQSQVVGLLGQNGAGKSTLLNILSGYLPATAGSVSIDGHSILTEPMLAKSAIGYLPEIPPLYPEMTVEVYLHFCCALKRVRPSQRKEHVDEIIEVIGLQEVRRRLIANLSKGYRQRTGLAQALCGAPRLLLLDEPTSGFDPAQVVEFRKTIRDLSRKHTIIFSSHILSEVQSVCERILILHQGRLVLDRDLCGAENQERAFHVLIAMGSDRILPAVRSLSSVKRVKKLSSDANLTELHVTVKQGSDFQRELFALLSGLQAPILELSPLQDRVEDVFLRFTASGLTAEADIC